MGRRAVLILLGAGCATALIEVLLRVFDPYGMSYYSEIDRYFRRLEYGGSDYYRHPANTCHVFQRVEICTDRLGLRVDPSKVEGSSDSGPGILVLGDSVVLGWGVGAEETLTAQLERLLAMEDGGRSFEVVNAGVASYNAEQERVQLMRLWSFLNPSAVLLVCVENDVESKRVEQEERARVGKRLWHFLRAHSRTAAGVEFLLRRTRSRPRPERYAVDSPLWAATRAELASIAEFCRSHGVPFGVMFFSPRADEEIQAAATRLREAADEMGVPFADAGMVFRASAPLPEITNSRSDGHPNGAGHRILAREALELLRRMGVIPGPPEHSEPDIRNEAGRAAP